MANDSLTRRRFLQGAGSTVALGAMGSALPWSMLRATDLPSAGEADWPRSGYDLHNTRFNVKEKTLGLKNVDRLKVKWQFETIDHWPVQTTPTFNSGEFPLMRTEYKGMNVFEWTFDVEGTYDYYSRDQESLGMVGRIVVGQPGYGGREGRAMVYPSEINVFRACTSKEIVAKKTITFPKDLNVISHPYGPIG